MTNELLILGTIAELMLVTGQLLLKKAMQRGGTATAAKRAACFSTSIGAQAVYFFLWLGLLRDFPLSSVYPFDAAALVLLVIAGIVILHERLTVRAAVAMGLIVCGLAVISLA